MLSSGTRIGPFHVDSWIKEGSCGQSYKGEGSAGEEKGKVSYLKLFQRDLSEKEGFSDYFSQECRAIEQIKGRGIWPMLSYGKMKWKHWIAYDWFEGATEPIPTEEEKNREINLKSLKDWMEFFPGRIGPDQLKDIMIDLHCGLNLAHDSGVIHGNLKPDNILISQKNDGTFEAWATEFALSKMVSFRPLNEDPSDGTVFLSQSMQFQESLKESQAYRPVAAGAGDLAEEQWDINALGGLVRYVTQKSQNAQGDWVNWQKWSEKALGYTFATIPQSLEAVPGVTDLAAYGIRSENSQQGSGLSDDEIRRKREIEWERDQKIATANFRRNITGLIGCLCLFTFLFSKIYLFFNPSPWMEYSVEGAADKYQLGFGVWSGKAWGILPASYDKDGDGGQDVAGEWERVDGMFRLKFRKFKKANEEESGKKLWQFIGKGSTTEDDYYIWSDYLSYNRMENCLELIKRVDEREVFLPGQRGSDSPHLFPEVRIHRSGGLIKKARLLFKQTQADGPSWSVFIGLGFLLASVMYHRIILRVSEPVVSTVND
jgi:serine/threonine protein kinase